MAAAAIAGTAMQQKAQSDAYKKQQKAIDKGLVRQGELQRQATQSVDEASEQYLPEMRRQRQEESEQEQTQYLQEALGEARGEDTGIGLDAPISGKVSQDYLVKRALAEVETEKRAAEYAAMLGKIAAPSRLRQTEAIGMGDLAADLARVGSFSAGEQGVTGLKANAAGMANPWMMGAGAALQAGAPMVGGAVGKWMSPTSPTGTFGTTRGHRIYQDPGGFTYNMPASRRITPIK